jgi:phosphoglucosamine mutase
MTILQGGKSNQVDYKKKWFGTDGIRGPFGQVPMTPEKLTKLGYIFGQYLQKDGHQKVLIGQDPRLSSDACVAALCTGLLSAGVDIKLLGLMPTPGVAYLARTLDAAAGIVISASHNPYTDNGIKFFNHQGFKFDDQVEAYLETKWEECTEIIPAAHLGRVTNILDGGRRYIEFCKNTLNHHFDLKGMTIVLDCAHGATSTIAPVIFEELGAEVIVTAAAPDGKNINADVGATHPAHLQAQVLQHKADLGIAFDGDGDRVVLVDDTGCVRDGDDILYVLASEKYQKHHGLAGLVGTLMTNLGLEQALLAKDIPLYRAAVGDRHVLSTLQQKGLLLGGETSGHIIDLSLTTTGDGIITALQVLSILASSQKTLFALLSDFKKYPQVMINVPVSQLTPDWKQKLATHQLYLEEKFRGLARIVIRPSGTEPVVRVMAEAHTQILAQTLVKELVDLAAA